MTALKGLDECAGIAYTACMSKTQAELVGVEVEYAMRRTIYVYAESTQDAKRLARDTVNWADEDDPFMVGDIRVPRQPS